MNRERSSPGDAAMPSSKLSWFTCLRGRRFGGMWAAQVPMPWNQAEGYFPQRIQDSVS